MGGAQLPRKRKSVDQRTKHRQICFQSKFITRQRQENLMTHILISASPVQRWVMRRDGGGTVPKGGPAEKVWETLSYVETKCTINLFFGAN